MTGILLAIAATVLLSFADAGKKRMVELSDPYFVIWSTAGVGLVLNWAFMLSTGLPQLEVQKLASFAPFSAGLIAVGELLFISAIRSGEISVSMPFKCFGPIFAIPVSFFALGETPSACAGAGVLLTVGGAYVMFLEGPLGRSLFAPIAAIFDNRGARRMMLAAMVFPLLGALQKMGAEASSSVFYVSLLLASQFTLFGTLYALKGGDFRGPFRRHPALVIGTGILWAVGLTMMFAAVDRTFVVYVAAIGQLQPLLTIPIAYVAFGETNSPKRLLPASIMVLGVIAVIVAQ